MSATIGVNNRPFIVAGHRFDSGIQHRVHKLGVGTRADRPTDYLPIEAVDHGGQVHLAGRDLELRDVREPFLIWGNSREVAVYEVFRRGTDLPEVGTVSTPFRLGDDQAFLLHQALHHLL
ncbi:hypothetical protein D3C80_1665750 [compost metagenome]